MEDLVVVAGGKGEVMDTVCMVVGGSVSFRVACGVRVSAFVCRNTRHSIELVGLSRVQRTKNQHEEQQTLDRSDERRHATQSIRLCAQTKI